MTRPGRYHAAVAKARRDVITAALLECGGNRSRAARLLGITRNQLYSMMHALQIDVPLGVRPRSCESADSPVAPAILRGVGGMNAAV